MRWVRMALVALATVCACLSVASATGSASADDRVSFRSFHDHLAPYGTWLNHARWGQVWRPNAGRGFRPYRDGGRWVNTDAYGVVWDSDYDWGDVAFHYGRWAYDPEWGWVWVPGYVWAPAWVIWREGDGNVGWLPMPPWIGYDGYGVFPDDWDNSYGYGEYIPEDAFFSLWSFVAADDLFEPRIGYYVIGPRYYSRFIRNTHGWTRFSILNGHLYNRSIDRDRFREAFGRPMPVSRHVDVEKHLGPVTDYAGGKRIEKMESAAGHAVSLHGGGSRPAATPHVSIRRENSVNVIRGGEAPVQSHVRTLHHTEYRTQPSSHSSTVYRAAPAHHEAPVSHAAPATRVAPSGMMHGAPPAHPAAPSNANRPH